MSSKLILLAGGGPRVQLPAAGISRSSIKGTPTQASAGFRLHSDGTIDATPNSSTSLSYTDDLGAWKLSGAASDYEAKVDTATPDGISGEASNTWLGLGTTRAWFAQTTSGIQDSNTTLRIRDATTFVELVNCPISMYAESS